MNAARRRIKQLRERLAKKRQAESKPQLQFVSPLAAQLHQSIEQVKARKFTKLRVMVFLKDGDDRIATIPAEHPTETIMSMQRNGFWTTIVGSPMFVPPYQISKVAILDAD